MRNVVRLAVPTILLLLLCGCGGGGGDNTPPTHNYPFNLSAGQSDTDSVTKTTVTASVATVGFISVQWAAQPGSRDVYTPGAYLEATCSSSSSTFTAYFPSRDLPQDHLKPVIQGVNGQWYAVPFIVEDGRVKVTVDLSAIQIDRSRTPAWLIRLGMLYIPAEFHFDNPVPRVVHLAGGGAVDHLDTSAGRAIVLVPCTNSGVEVFDKLVPRILARGKYKSIYGLSYPWYAHIAGNAEKLAEFVNALATGEQVDALGYSMGGLVCAYAIGPGRASKHVKNFFAIGCPFNGVKEADDHGVASSLDSIGLNDPESFTVLRGTLHDGVQDGTRDMVPGTPFLQKLHNPYYSHQNGTHYYAVAGDQRDWQGWSGRFIGLFNYPGETFDGLVPLSSAYGIDGLAMTAGLIDKRIWHYNHGELIRDAGAIQQIIDLMDRADENGGQLDMFAQPNAYVYDPNVFIGGWTTSQFFVNRSPYHPLTVNTLTYRFFSADGEWMGDHPYPPSGSWNQYLQSLEGTDLTINFVYGIKPDGSYVLPEEIPEVNRSWTVWMIASGTEGALGAPFGKIAEIKLRYKADSVLNPPKAETIGKLRSRNTTKIPQVIRVKK